MTPIISMPVIRLPTLLLTMTRFRHSSSGNIGSAARRSCRASARQVNVNDGDQRQCCLAGQRAPLHRKQHQQRHRDDQQNRPQVVDVPLPNIHVFRQEQCDHGDGGNSNWQIDPEYQRPVAVLHDEGAKRRPDDGRHPEHAGQHPLHSRALDRRIDVADDRIGDRLHAPGSQTLQRAERDELQHAV